ncbi:alpha/beta hydrolase [Paraburkholderia acidicola]|uniref:Alpha/beta hydrolase n=1 Tax=Paraburkholderia acidicola TaxID=1912599 RepID=A0ABV1LL48_9BURK
MSRIVPTQDDPQPEFATLASGRIAYTVSGHGGHPTVVLETGLGAESAEWQPIQVALAAHCTVFRYDRLGRGASDRPLTVRHAGHLIDELHALLQATAMPPPYLIVGHSFGGLLARGFAQRYRDEMHGLVLVESMHTRQFSVFGNAFPPPGESDTPEQTRMRTLWAGEWRLPDATPEHIDLPTSLDLYREIAPLGDLPVTVITAGSYANSRFFPTETRDALQARWEYLQRELLQLSTQARQIMTPASQHFVQRDDPDVVIDAVLAML